MPEAQKMENKKRLIDANALKMFLEDVRQDYLEKDTFSSDFAAKVIETVQDEYLALATTVDAVEVVRCKKCRFSKYFEESGTRKCRTQNGMYRTVEDSDFCSYGEREDNETL